MRTVKNRLGRGASADAIAFMLIKLVTICLGFVVTRLLSQHLSTYDYGTYSQVLLISTTVSSLTILGMIDGVNFFHCCTQNVEEQETYTATLFSMQCIVSASAGAVVMLLGSVISAGFENPDVKKFLLFAAVLPLLQNLISMLQILMVSVGKARMIALRNLIVSVVRLAAVLLVVNVARNVALILAVTVVMDAAQIALFLWILRKNGCKLSLRNTDFRLVYRILNYCIPMAVFTVIHTLNRDCDKYLIAWLTDTETLAIYTNASKILPFDIILTSFCTVLQPEITRLVAERKWNTAASLYRLFLEITYVSTTIMCGAALCAAPQLMELLYTSKYLSGLTVFSIYILVDMIRFTNLTMILTAAGKTKKLMYLSFLSFGANALLNILLFYIFGMTGPALATFVTTLGVGLAMFSMGAKELGIGWTELFDLKYMGVFLAENLVALCLFTMLQRGLTQRGVHYILVLFLTCIPYGVCLLALNGKRILQNLKQVNRVSDSRI